MLVSKNNVNRVINHQQGFAYLKYKHFKISHNNSMDHKQAETEGLSGN